MNGRARRLRRSLPSGISSKQGDRSVPPFHGNDKLLPPHAFPGIALAVSFREVVHSDRTEETGVTTLQHPSEGPNEHPQECPSNAAASR